MIDAFASGPPPVQLIRCEPATNHSFFFDLIQSHSPGNKALHRLCSLMRKMKVSAYTREELLPNQEIQEEASAATLRCGATVTTNAVRLSFFRSCPPTGDWHDLEQQDFLGYAVILTQQLPDGSSRPFILESIVRPPSIFISSPATPHGDASVSNYYPHCVREFRSVIGTATDHKQFRIVGNFFCQQNNLTHVCAHAALRMAINSSPRLNMAKLTNQSINHTLGIDHVGRAVGNYNGDDRGGVTDPQIQHVIRRLTPALDCHYADFNQNPGVEYAAFLYPLVESRAPVILAIDGPSVSHVVSVLGHTVNSDRWEPEARQGYGSFPFTQYISSSAWADHFIINDDNLGMYVTLPTQSIHNFIVPKYNPNIHAAMAVGILAPGIIASGYETEMTAALCARSLLHFTQPAPGNRWLNCLKEVAVAHNPPWNALVCRTLLVSKTDYVAHMSSVTDSEGHRLNSPEIASLHSQLPDLFWMTEIALPDLYTANKTKLGDIISRTNPTQQEYIHGDGVIFAWLAGIARGGSGLAGPQVTWSLTGHIPILRTGPVPALEW